MAAGFVALRGMRCSAEWEDNSFPLAGERTFLPGSRSQWLQPAFCGFPRARDEDLPFADLRSRRRTMAASARDRPAPLRTAVAGAQYRAETHDDGRPCAPGRMSSGAFV